VLLVPRQLQRSGMTGSVPYYGGRFTPAQAYAASHAAVPRSAPPSPAGVPLDVAEGLRALQYLLDTGVLTRVEFDGLRARVLG
jgi:hypothetical protein